MPDIQILNIGMFGLYLQISVDDKYCPSELPDSQSLIIGLFGTYVQISNVSGRWMTRYLSVLPDIHTLDTFISAPGVQLSHVY